MMNIVKGIKNVHSFTSERIIKSILLLAKRIKKRLILIDSLNSHSQFNTLDITAIDLEMENKSKSCLFRIPPDLFREIKTYSSNYNYWLFISATKSGDFLDIKRETVHFHLQIDTLEEFQAEYPQILSKISSPFHQFSLTLKLSWVFYLDKQTFGRREFLTLLKDLSCQILQLYNSSVLFNDENERWISYIQKNKQQVILLYSSKLMDLPLNESFAGERISFNGGNLIQNFHPFQNVKKLSLFACSELKDVSYLGNVLDLRISDCHQLVDLAGLGNVRILSISSCSKITDISPLTNNYSLSLFNCPVKIGIQESFAKVTILYTDLIRSTKYFKLLHSTQSLQVRKISVTKLVFTNTLHRLTIWEGDIGSFSKDLKVLHKVCLISITTLKSLPDSFISIPLIYLRDCRNLEDISCLGMNKQVIIDGCNRIQDFQVLDSIPSVEILSCEGFTNPQHVANVHSLKLVFLSNISDVTMLRNVSRLEINGCDNVISLRGLENVQTLVLVRLRFNDLPDDVNNEKLVLRNGNWKVQHLLTRYTLENILFPKKMDILLKK